MRLRSTIDLVEAARKLDGRTQYQGLDISIENRTGSVRKGVDQDGKPWQTKMKNDYGYIRLSEGTDGDHVDCFIGPNKSASKVFVVHIKNPKTGEYDEDKCFLGFNSVLEARKCFDKHYDDPTRFYMGMDVLSIDDFKKRVLDKSNHGSKIEASDSWGNTAVSMAYLDPIPSFHPPSAKSGKSYVPSDNPGETDDSMLDVTNRKSAAALRDKLLQKKAAPMPIGHTAVQHHTGSSSEFLWPHK